MSQTDELLNSLSDNATVSGVWKFKEVLETTTYVSPVIRSDTGESDVTFTSNGQEYYHLECSPPGSDYELMYGWGGAFPYTHAGGWIDEAYRTIDFGTTEYIVPIDFYTWLTNNADKVVPPKVSGVWTFKEVITLDDTEEDVNFMSCGSAYTHITAYSNEYGLMYGWGTIFPYTRETGWMDEGYRTIDFGDTEQPVSSEFYDWLVANTIQPDVTPENTEPHIIVDEDRYIHVPDELKKIAVQGDKNIETVTFDCPRYWDGNDLSGMKVSINFELSDKTFGNYEVDEVTIDEEDDTIIHFNWTINEDVTLKEGPIKFNICVKEVDEVTGEDLRHWNSEINNEMYISKGMDWDSDLSNAQRNYVSDLITRGEQAVTVAEISANDARESKEAIEENIGDFNETLDSIIGIQNSITEGKVINSALLAYPVGAIYISVASTNPGAIFGGTWQRLQDMFLYAAGPKHPAGTIDGSEEHTHDAGKLFAEISTNLRTDLSGLPTGTFLALDEAPRGEAASTKRHTVISSTGVTVTRDLDNDSLYGTQYATKVSGTTEKASNMPPYLAVYMWQRIA